MNEESVETQETVHSWVPRDVGEPQSSPSLQLDAPIWTSRTWINASVALVLLMVILLATGHTSAEQARTTVIVIALAAMAIIAGASWRSSRQRRAYQQELVEWSARRAVEIERLRIARELHDLASHGLGTITVRAAAGRLQRDVSGYLRALEDIEETSRRSTLELRRMLRVLREPHQLPAEFRPVEDLRELPLIISDGEARGLSITTDITDEPAIERLSAGAQLAICAAVREGLINASQHAGGTKVHLSIARVEEDILMRVIDQGPVPGWHPARGAGYGLVGLRERIAALGGGVMAERHGRGFALTVRIPAEEGL